MGTRLYAVEGCWGGFLCAGASGKSRLGIQPLNLAALVGTDTSDGSITIEINVPEGRIYLSF